MHHIQEQIKGRQRMMGNAGIFVTKQCKFCQHASFLCHLLHIVDRLFLDPLDAVVHFFPAGKHDAGIRTVIADAVLLLQPRQIRIQSLIAQMAAQSRQIIFQQLRKLCTGKFIQPMGLLFKCRFQRRFQLIELFVRKQQIAGRDDIDAFHLTDRPLASFVEEADALDDIIEEFNADRMFIIHRIHIDDPAACRIAQRLIHMADLRIAAALQPLLQHVIFDLIIDVQMKTVGAKQSEGRQQSMKGSRIDDEDVRPFPLQDLRHHLELFRLCLRRSRDRLDPQRFFHDQKQRILWKERGQPLMEALCRVTVVFYHQQCLWLSGEPCRQQQGFLAQRQVAQLALSCTQIADGRILL